MLGGSAQSPGAGDVHGLSLHEALGAFVQYLRDEKQASPFTLEAYERDLLRFVGELGGEPAVVDVTPEIVREHMQRLIARRLATATIRRALYALRSFFSWAVRWRHVQHNPVDQITIPRRERTRVVRALSKAERVVLIAAADKLAITSRRPLDRQAPLLVRLMLKTGLRRSEVIGLLWCEVDIERGDLFVRYGKGKKSRRVPVADKELLSMLTAARKLDIDAPVFASTRGKRLTFATFYRIFHRALAQAELRGTGITPHSLRHTFGTVLCARGVPVPYVKDLLGHEDIGSTMIYVHSTPTALRQAVRKLAE